MKLIGLARLGRDAEVRYTPEGTPVANFTAAFNYGRKDSEGKRPSQWVSVALWGERAEKLAEFLTKGRQVFLVCSDVHVETYEKKNEGGAAFRLVARVDDLALTAGQRDDGAATAPAPALQQNAARPPAAKSSTGFDDMDNDIPF